MLVCFAEGAGKKIFNGVSASWWDKRKQQKIGFSVSFSTSWSCGNKVSVQDSQSAFCHGHYHDSVPNVGRLLQLPPLFLVVVMNLWQEF